MSQSENHTIPDFSSKLHGIRKDLGLTQEEMAARLGISANYVSLLEGGKKRPSNNLMRTLDMMLQQEGTLTLLEVQHHGTEVRPSAIREDEVPYRGGPQPRLVPVVSWAAAGKADRYEDIPAHWMAKVISDCPDPKAFSVYLEGDSMDDQFREGDRLTLMPSEKAYSGCLVVARFVTGGAVFRRYEASGDRIQFVALNDRYPVSDHDPTEFSWIFPVWGRWTQIWRR